jgi:hypothetical protein
MLEEPISPELALVHGVPAGGWPAADRTMVDPLDARRPAVTASPSSSVDASVSVEALIFQAGLITADQLGELVRDSVVLNRPAAEIAVERGLVSSAALQQVLAKVSPPAPVALPFPLPAEALPPHNAVADVEPAIEPVIVAELHPVVVPDAPPAPVPAFSPFSPEALQALIAPVPTADPLPAEVQAVHEISSVEAPEPPPVAPVAPAMPPVAVEQSPPVVLLSAEPVHAAEEPVVEPGPPAMPPMAAEPPAEPAPLASAMEPVLPATPSLVAEPPAEPSPTPVATVFAVLLRLQTGERIAVDTAASFEAAAEVARELAGRFARATEWPLLAGRCIRPEAVVSVDIERTLEA